MLGLMDSSHSTAALTKQHYLLPESSFLSEHRQLRLFVLLESFIARAVTTGVAATTDTNNTNSTHGLSRLHCLMKTDTTLFPLFHQTTISNENKEKLCHFT